MPGLDPGISQQLKIGTQSKLIPGSSPGDDVQRQVTAPAFGSLPNHTPRPVKFTCESGQFSVSAEVRGYLVDNPALVAPPGNTHGGKAGCAE
jgi:hypothetical protein